MTKKIIINPIDLYKRVNFLFKENLRLEKKNRYLEYAIEKATTNAWKM